MKHKALLLFPALIVALLQAQQGAPFLDTIRKEAMKPELYFLASDAMQGRLTDTPTNFIAEEYVKSRFEAIGLAPAGSGRSYYQNFNLMLASLGNGNRLEVAVPGKATLRLQPGQDYYPHSYSASAQVRAPVVYAGFGITAPDLDYDDFRGADFKGKIALVINDEPGERDPDSPFDGIVRFEGSSPLRKALFAQERGAIGILFTRDVHNHLSQTGEDRPAGLPDELGPGAAGRPAETAPPGRALRDGDGGTRLRPLCFRRALLYGACFAGSGIFSLLKRGRGSSRIERW